MKQLWSITVFYYLENNPSLAYHLEHIIYSNSLVKVVKAVLKNFSKSYLGTITDVHCKDVTDSYTGTFQEEYDKIMNERNKKEQ